MKTDSQEEKAIEIFNKNNGILATAQALKQGIHCRTLYKLRDEGKIIKIARGLYRLSGMPELSAPDLVTIALKIPKGVICLISALSFHEITTHIPHKVNVALRRKTITPRLKYPPIDVVRFSGKAFEEGIEKHKVDGIEIKVYSVAKTIADCFKFRNKIGLDVAIEALKLALTRKKSTRKEIFKYANICGVEKIIRPYMEAI